jgi:peroxiredoxin (alkyl hydroperoxide reductase subunit C)
MLGIGQKLADFQITGVKPKFMQREQKGECAFAPLTEHSFAVLWKVIFFYPKNLTFVCPAEIAEFARLAPEFADTNGSLTDGLGARDEGAGFACRATCIVDPHTVIGHVCMTNLNFGRNPQGLARTGG